MSSSPGWVVGYTPPAAEWNTTFANKADESEVVLKLNAAGTTTNNDAAAGAIGEFQMESTVASAMATGIPMNATSLPLTAGDWDVWGNASFLPAGTTTFSNIVLGLNNTSATLPGGAGGQTNMSMAFTTGAIQDIPCTAQRFSFSGPSTVFLVAQAAFAVSTMNCTGFVYARRVR